MPFIYWQNIIKDIFAKMINPQSSGTSLLTKTTLGCVYTDSDRVHMKITYNLNDNDIYTVGNPDLMHFGFDENDIGFQFNQNNFNFNKEIVYIDTGLIQAGFVFNSYGEYYQHLLITEQALANQGYSLAFKPHPDHYHNGELLSLLKESSIRIIHKEDFIGSIKLCAAVIVEPSTLSLIPALMGKTIFLANYNKLAKQKYGQILLEYPFSVILNDLIFFESLRDYLSNQVINVGFLDWVKNNSGPLPADKMPERVFFSLNNYFNKNA
jgi:hypothetical protein